MIASYIVSFSQGGRLGKFVQLDEQGVIWCNSRRRPAMDMVMRGASFLGDGPLWIILVLVLFTLGGEFGVVAWQLAGSLLLNVVLYTALKRAASRPRPFDTLPAVSRGARIPDDFSFPSGHTAAAVVVTVVLGSASPFLMGTLGGLVFLIGMSRVYLGMHYPSDVVAGGVLGFVCGVTGISILP